MLSRLQTLSHPIWVLKNDLKPAQPRLNQLDSSLLHRRPGFDPPTKVPDSEVSLVTVLPGDTTSGQSVHTSTVHTVCDCVLCCFQCTQSHLYCNTLTKRKSSQVQYTQCVTLCALPLSIHTVTLVLYCNALPKTRRL